MVSFVGMITVGVIPGIVGALLAYRYTAFALVPVAFFFIVLGITGCAACGLSFPATTLAVLFGLTSLHSGYFLGLFVPQTNRRIGAKSSGPRTAQRDLLPKRPFGAQRRDVRPSVPSRADL
jgi:hypothetical protein